MDGPGGDGANADEIGVDRRTVERRLDEAVRANRVTIAVVVPLVGVALLLAGRAGLVPDAVAFNPYAMVVAVLVMALPLIAGVAPIVDRRAAAGLAALAAFAWSIEFVAVHTGWPYGEFAYQRDLGPMLLDAVPLALPVFFLPILVNGYLLGVLLLGSAADRLEVRLPVVVALVVGLDLVLDPGAVALGFWAWTEPGPYYGVPLQNVLGWVLAASVSVGILHCTFDHEAVVARLDDCEYLLDDLVNFALFWGLVNLAVGNLLPVALAVGVLLALARAPWFDLPGVDRGAQRSRS